MRSRHFAVAIVCTLLVGLVGPGRAVGDRRDGGCHRFDKLDVAGRVGRAFSMTFNARVTDRLLVVRLARALGEPPILTSIRVTWLGS